MNHNEILEALSDAINALDAVGKLGEGDKLMEVIQALKAEWEIED